MKIALIGYGKMGRAIETLAPEAGDEIVLRIDAENQAALTPENLRAADVAIEFTRPEAAFGNILPCLRAGVPVVSGTTGWQEQLPEARAAAERSAAALFYAANYSIGVNLFFAVNRYLARLMEGQPQYDVYLREIHHTAKLDAPSGTAIHLAEEIIAALSRKTHWTGDQSTPQADAIPIASERIDPTPGTHVVTYSSAIDDLRIEHVAHSREGFARGALAAARWLVGRRGFFTMSDMLGF